MSRPGLHRMSVDKKLRVIVANDFGYIDGGSTAVAFDQAKSLRSRGHEVELFVGQTQVDDDQGPHVTEVSGFRTMSLGCPNIWDQPSRLRAAANGIFNTQVSKALSDLISMGATENVVVLIHSWTKTLSPSIFRAVQQLNLRSVLVLHDFFVGCPNGVYFDYGNGEYCSRRPLSTACLQANCDKDSRAHKWWRTLRHGVAHTVCGLPRNLDRLVCVSDYLEAIVRPWVNDPKRLLVLPNRVSGFSPLAGPIGAEQERRGFAYLGRLSEEKGARRLAHAAKLADAQVTFIGEGPLRSELEELLPHARYTGWLSSAEVADKLQQCSALVYPSLWRESFGLAVYEAASIRVPSIIPQGAAMADFVRHGENGLIFRSDEELVGLLKKASAAPQWMAELGAQAERDFRAYAQRTSDYDAQLEQILFGVLNGL